MYCIVTLNKLLAHTGLYNPHNISSAAVAHVNGLAFITRANIRPTDLHLLPERMLLTCIYYPIECYWLAFVTRANATALHLLPERMLLTCISYPRECY